jgi:SAM-dependent methyltransferase
MAAEDPVALDVRHRAGVPGVSDPRLQNRNCPLCRSERRRELFAMSAEDIFAANWSYHRHAIASLRLSPGQSFPIVRCLDCAFVYAGLLPANEFLSTVYDEVIDTVAARAHSFSAASMSSRMLYLSRLLRLLSMDEGRRSILDFGCGFGPTLSLLATVGSVSAMGFDSSALRIEELRTRGFRASNRLEDLDNSAPFHAVILDNVLEHMPDPRQTLDQVAGWCAEDAVVFVGVPEHSAALVEEQRVALGQGRSASMEINPWEHLNYFDAQHLDALMTGAGFSAVKQAEIPGEVEVGLRAETQFKTRQKNAAASMMRLAKYAWTGALPQNMNARFYRRSNAQR